MSSSRRAKILQCCATFSHMKSQTSIKTIPNFDTKSMIDVNKHPKHEWKLKILVPWMDRRLWMKLIYWYYTWLSKSRGRLSLLHSFSFQLFLMTDFAQEILSINQSVGFRSSYQLSTRQKKLSFEVLRISRQTVASKDLIFEATMS